MALPVGKLVKAAQALRGAGKVAKAAALEARIGAKQFGKELPRIASLANKMSGGMPGSIVTAGKASKVTGRSARAGSEGVFPRAPKKGFLGDLEAGALPGSNMTNAQARRLAASRAADRAGNYTPVRELEKRLKLPKGRGK
jgi:hypothetical protein